MPNHEPQKTTDELQEEIEHTRAELDSTLDEIGKRLSPREIKERTVSYVKDTAGSLSDALQRNPVPVAIAGTALAATLLARSRSSARLEREREEQVRELWDRLVGALERRASGFSAGDTMGRLSNLATDAKDDLVHTLSAVLAGAQRQGGDALADARHVGHDLAGHARHVGNDLAGHARHVGHDAGERAHELARAASDRAHDVGRAAGDSAERLLEDVSATARTHPYLTIAVAIASGALLLMALRR